MKSIYIISLVVLLLPLLLYGGGWSTASTIIDSNRDDMVTISTQQTTVSEISRIRIINTIIYNKRKNGGDEEKDSMGKHEMIDVVYNKSIRIEKLGYLTLTDFMVVSTGPISIEVYEHASNRLLSIVSKSVFRLENDTDYTLVLSGIHVDHDTIQQQQELNHHDKKERIGISILTDLSTSSSSSTNQQQNNNIQFLQTITQQQQQQQQQQINNNQQNNNLNNNGRRNRMNVRFVQCIEEIVERVDFGLQGGSTLFSDVTYIAHDRMGISSAYISIPSRFYQFHVHQHDNQSNVLLTFDNSNFSSFDHLIDQQTNNNNQQTNNQQQTNNNQQQYLNQFNNQQNSFSLLMVGSIIDNDKYPIMVVPLPYPTTSSTIQSSDFIQSGDHYTYSRRQQQSTSQRLQMQQLTSTSSSADSFVRFTIAIISFLLLFGMTVI